MSEWTRANRLPNLRLKSSNAFGKAQQRRGSGVVKAEQLANQYGNKLVGREVLTQPMGEYPGGYAIVTQVHPDPGAAEIVFNVKHPTFGEVGIFEYEVVVLVAEVPSH